MFTKLSQLRVCTFLCSNFGKLRDCPSCSLGAAVLFLSVTIVTWFAVDLQNRYEGALEDGSRTARRYAGVLAEHTARTFEGVERALNEAEQIRRLYDSGLLGTANDAHDALRRVKQTSPVISAIGWTNAEGDLLVHTYDGAPPRPNISDLSYFSVHRDSQDSGLIIASPFLSIASGNWITSVSRRIATPDGSFAGIFSVVLDLSYFSSTFRSIVGSSGGAALLIHRRGEILIREPHVASLVGKSFQNSPLLSTRLPKSNSGSYESVNVIDDVPRIIGYAAVENIPLVALINYPRAEILAPWYRSLYIYGSVTALQLVVILIGAAVLARRTNALVEAKNSVEDANARLVLATSNMNHGLAVFDADSRLVMCNEKYASIFGLTLDQLKPGISLQEIFDLRLQQGIFAGGYPFSYLSDRIFYLDHPGARIFELKDGRSILMEHISIAGGGWVATHADITERRRLERQASEQANRLRQHEEDLRIQNMTFKAALENMTEGLSMFDADERLLVWNDQFGSMYNLPAELLKVGTLHDDIVAYRLRAGVSVGENTDVAIAQRIQDLKLVQRDIPTHRIEELTDGRLIHITRQPLELGGWVATHKDVTDRHRHEARISFMAHHDLLTGLANRVFFTEKIEEAVARLRRHDEPFAIFMLDLDKFKNVNDTLGHPAGDQLLRETAQRLKSALRETDILARLGGDEFAIIQLAQEKHRESAASLARRIVSIISEPYDLGGNTAFVGASIGIALAPNDADESTELLRMADLALYAAKSAGRNDFRFFDESMMAETDNRRTLEDELRFAIQRGGEFELRYQPVIDVKSRRPVGFEAQVSWRNPVRGLIPPDELIPLAEETGLIVPLGAWVLQQACADAAKWPPHLKVAVNLSPLQLGQPDLLQIVLCALTEASLTPKRIELEITETALFKSEIDYVTLIRKLKNLGISIALDDFGTGHSSLSYLTMFPFDRIKIDQSFIRNLTRRADCAAIVSAVLALGRNLSTETVALGVETEQHFGILRASGVTYVQGPLFGAPCGAAELALDEAPSAALAESAA